MKQLISIITALLFLSNMALPATIRVYLIGNPVPAFTWNDPRGGADSNYWVYTYSQLAMMAAWYANIQYSATYKSY